MAVLALDIPAVKSVAEAGLPGRTRAPGFQTAYEWSASAWKAAGLMVQ